MYSGCIARPIAFAAITSATAQMEGYEAVNAATYQPREQAVFTVSPAVIDIDLGAATDVRLAAMVRSNATAWSLKGASSQAGLASAADIVSDSLAGALGVAAAFYDETAHSHRWWRLTLTGPTPLYLGRIILADPFIPQHSFSFGRVNSRQPGLKYKAAAGGALHAEQNPQYRQWALTYEAIRDDEYKAELDALDAYPAGGGAVLFLEDPAAADAAEAGLYGLMTINGGATRTSLNRWRAPIQLMELT
jgi:hypothetical protein